MVPGSDRDPGALSGVFGVLHGGEAGCAASPGARGTLRAVSPHEICRE